MMALNKKLWPSLSILGAVALITGATIYGGIEWALASLGLMALIAMVAAGVHIAIKISRYTDKSIYNECLEYARTFATSDNVNQGHTADDIPVRVNPVNKRDRRSIMAHIDELFGISTKGEGEKSSKAKPVNKRDKKLIMAHIYELFEMNPEHSEERLY